MHVALLAVAACVATFVGGFFALRFRDHLHLVLGFSAGAVAGVALFDLLPETIELGSVFHSPETLSLFVAFGFFGYLVLDRLILLHSHDEGGADHSPRASFGALALSAHSFLDGVAIGIAFQVSLALGFVVAAAVLTHDFSDGINTVGIVLRHRGSWKRAMSWLFVDALAPVAGVFSTLFFVIPEQRIGLVLAVFVGTFLYLSAGDLIPESHHRHPRALTTFMTLLGAGLMYVIVRIVAL